MNSDESQTAFQYPVTSSPKDDLMFDSFSNDAGAVSPDAAVTQNSAENGGKSLRGDNDSGFTDNEVASNNVVCEQTLNSSSASTSVASRQSLKLDLQSEDSHNLSKTSLNSVCRTVSTPVFSTPVESATDVYVTDDGISSPSSPKHWWSTAGVFSTPTYAKMRHFAQSPVQPFARAAVAVSRNPFMSPLLASDEQLEKLCPVYMVVRLI